MSIYLPRGCRSVDALSLGGLGIYVQVKSREEKLGGVF